MGIEPDYDRVRSEVVEALCVDARPRQAESIRKTAAAAALKLKARWRSLEPLSFIRFGFRRADRYPHYWLLLVLLDLGGRGSEFDKLRHALDRQLDQRERS